MKTPRPFKIIVREHAHPVDSAHKVHQSVLQSMLESMLHSPDVFNTLPMEGAVQSLLADIGAGSYVVPGSVKVRAEGSSIKVDMNIMAPLTPQDIACDLELKADPS